MSREESQLRTGQVRIKLCGLTRPADIAAANSLMPDYIGFVFAPKSRRYVAPGTALALRQKMQTGIVPVGVFVDECPDTVASLVRQGVIEVVQLHGHEDAPYIARLRALIDCPLIQAFRVDSTEDVRRALASQADYLLLDSGNGGTGTAFDWSLIREIERPYFLAGGLNPDNVAAALNRLTPFAVDVSSGIETDGIKDSSKMAAFVAAVRHERYE